MSDLLNDFTLDFEKPVRALEKQIEELQEAEKKSEIDISKEITALQKKVNSLIKPYSMGEGSTFSSPKKTALY